MRKPVRMQGNSGISCAALIVMISQGRGEPLMYGVDHQNEYHQALAGGEDEFRGGVEQL